MRGGRTSQTLRLAAVVAVALSPLAAVDAQAAVQTGDANASGPGVAVANNGGNVEIGTGTVESRVIIGDPASAPAAAPIPSAPALSVPARKAVPGADAAAAARAEVEAARARAQAQIDEARRMAEEAAQRARQEAAEAQARSDAQAEQSRAQAGSHSSGDYSNYTND